VAAALPTGALTYPADVTDGAAMTAAARDFIARHGAPDIVIANAGVSVGTSPDDLDDLDVLGRVLATNVIGLAATFQPFVATLRAERRGTLVGIASVAGFRGLPGGAAYSASKAAAITWLESLRTELHGSGVRVVTLCPGYIDTPMTRVNSYRMPFLLAPDEAARRFARVIDAGRRFAVVPWPMWLASLVLRALPRPVYEWAFARAPRKPRKLPT
jgi:NAD(P)-dependent dehydrogenase (short-subunit alcohol dehydrogenase family)